MIVRPRKFNMLRILDWKCLIVLEPWQKWKVTFTNGKYNISRDNVTLNFSKEEYEKYFWEVE